MTYKRVLLKLSGEALGAPETGHGIDPAAVRGLAAQVARVREGGTQLALVCGLALSDALEAQGLETRVMTALEVRSVAEPYVRRRALRHLAKGRVVILAGGLGAPLFTTDTAAAQRAVELNCEVLLKATKVDGVYTADPKKDPAATRIDSLSYMQVLSEQLRVMDGTAVTMCMEHGLPVVVFDLFQEGNLERVVQGQTDLGTTIGS